MATARQSTSRNYLAYLHLSDIHFKKRIGGDTWDVDALLRNELEIDVNRLGVEHGPLDGVLVTGDIAFSGDEEQYDIASEWLSKIASIAGCDESDIWIVPGNHDVRRREVSDSRTIQDFHTRMRSCQPEQIDDELLNYLVADKAGGSAYLAPLRQYIAFATRYDCSITSTKPFWEDTIPIGTTGYSLRIRGMTSPLISDERDDQDGSRLVLGTAQARIERRPLTVTMTLAHHPPPWLRDGVEVEDLLRTRAGVQLWGHRHVQNVRVMDGNVHLFAGAVQPQRRELNWEPRYNVVEIRPKPDATQCEVVVRERVWRRQEARFGPDLGFDGNESRTVILNVEPRLTLGLEETPMAPEVSEPGSARGARRSLAYGFSSLPYQRRLSVARTLQLLDSGTRDVPDQELFDLVLSRAVREGRLAELWAAVQGERGRSVEPNPFNNP